ncbi:MAG TPA: DUF1634 domain-containing protein [Gemmatimonadaceae bacterium]|nr:DUF1634 domain-containing protein [Gemmatimonadaceae bacterium]
MEQLIGNLLRIGVLIAAAVALVGGVMYLAHSAFTRPSYHVFRGEPPMLRSIGGILSGVAALEPTAIIQLGIVLLIATPIARVLLTLIAFAVRRDRMYVLISALVLGLLAYSLLAG